MSKLIIPKDYKPSLDPTETQRAIKRIKDHFQREELPRRFSCSLRQD